MKYMMDRGPWMSGDSLRAGFAANSPVCASVFGAISYNFYNILLLGACHGCFPALDARRVCP
jgi:hypothetical protein